MRRILITGSSSGLGRALAIYFLERGDFVYAAYRSPESRPAVFQEQRRNYPDRIRELDISLDGIDGLAAEIDRLDILINNLGMSHAGLFESYSREDLEAAFQANLFFPWLLTVKLLPKLRQSRDPRIFAISSVHTLLPVPLYSAYIATKAGLESAFQSLAIELHGQPIQVASLLPGSYKTRIIANTKWNADEEPLAFYPRYSQKLYKAGLDDAIDMELNSVDAFCRKVYRLSWKKRLDHRYVIGWDARIASWLHGLLPSPLYFRLVKRILGELVMRNKRWEGKMKKGQFPS